MSYWPKSGRFAKTTFGGLTRSKLMSRVRSRGNKTTEVALAKLFRRHKITGWRRQIQIITPRPSPGLRPPSPAPASEGRRGKQKFRVRPDFVFRQVRLALFVDGCFWHGCPKHGTPPKGNAAFWRKKISRNQIRDRLVTRTLRRIGWRVLRIWEHELARRNEAHLNRRIQRVLL